MNTENIIINPVFDGGKPEDRRYLAELLKRHGFIDISRKIYERERKKRYNWPPYEESTKFYFNLGYKRYVIFDYVNISGKCQTRKYGSFAGIVNDLHKISNALDVFFFIPGMKYNIKRNNLLPFIEHNQPAIFESYSPCRVHDFHFHTKKKDYFEVDFYLPNKKGLGNGADVVKCMNYEVPFIFEISSV
jgi:hypothetical protein